VAIGALVLVVGMAAPLSAGQATLLANPEAARANAASSPKHDDRVLVYSAEAISGSIVEHVVDSRAIALDVGAKDGVRFGHAFQIMGSNSKESIGVAKVIELERQRCIANVVYLDRDQAAQSLRGLSAVCAAPKPNKRATVIQCVVGKSVWQTESFENKLIRGLLETGGKGVQILIREENAYQPSVE